MLANISIPAQPQWVKLLPFCLFLTGCIKQKSSTSTGIYDILVPMVLLRKHASTVINIRTTRSESTISFSNFNYLGWQQENGEHHPRRFLEKRRQGCRPYCGNWRRHPGAQTSSGWTTTERVFRVFFILNYAYLNSKK